MSLDFDHNGFLIPYDKIEITIDIFQQVFVNKFPLESTRHNLFVNYLHFLNDFREQVTPNFIQWIGGSFVTKKESPNDIDIVTLIDSEVYEHKEHLIDSCFKTKGALEKYGLDAFDLRVYPEKNPKFAHTKGDMVYWHTQWSTARKDRFGKKRSKGFVEIKF